MIYKDFCIQPETKIDEEFIEQEMDFLIEVSIKNQELYKDTASYAAVVKQRYSTWFCKNK